MRKTVISRFVGFVVAATFLAACGGAGVPGVPQVNVDELTALVLELQSELANTNTRLASAERAKSSPGPTAKEAGWRRT